MSTGAAGVLCEVADDVATITLDKPERRNSQTPSMWRELARIGAELVDTVRVVVVRGNGAAFSAGLDRDLLTGGGLPGEQSIADLMTAPPGEVDAVIEEFQRGFLWLHDPRVISIAAVHGYAIGGGFQLALACDLRVVADTARLCMKEPALGIVPDLAGTKPLVDAVGYSRALEICATGRFVGADEAVRIGLALAAVPEAELSGTVDDLVAAILEVPTGAVRETKGLLQGAAAHDLDTQRRREREAQIRRFADLSGGRD